jgi:uncharacterized protein YcbK (DUF882 family)
MGALSLAISPDECIEASQRLVNHSKKVKQRMPTRQIVCPPKPKNPKDLYTGELSFVNMHTGESVRVQYLNKKRQIDRLACRQLDYFFRCHYTGKVAHISPDLFLLLDSVRNVVGARKQPYMLFSGYRSPAYNSLLAEHDSHVARNSYHLRGMAADISLEGIGMSRIEKVAKNLGVGGVGGYNDFVHLDVGPIRCW